MHKLAVVAAVTLTAAVAAMAILVLNYAVLWACEAGAAGASTQEDVLRALRTGDVVAFGVRRPGTTPYVAALVTRTTTFHVGIVVGSKLLHYSAPSQDWFYRPQHLCDVPGPNLSDLRELVRGFAEYDALVHVVRPPHPSPDAATLLREARALCGTPYDTRFIRSFLFSKRGEGEMGCMQCNTFVGAMFERLGMLPARADPVRDYRPGRILDLLESEGGFRRVLVARFR